MFSPPARKTHFASQRNRTTRHGAPTAAPVTDSPSTPLAEPSITPIASSSAIPNRPATGTPAPWASRLSVIARVSPANKIVKGSDGDQMDPVYVGDFPQVVRDAQAEFLRKHAPGDAGISGGMDTGTCLAWIICGNRIFIWSFLAPSFSRNCVTLEIPSVVVSEDTGPRSKSTNDWMVCIVQWDGNCKSPDKAVSTGVLLCNRISEAFVYWPDINAEIVTPPVTSILPSSKSQDIASGRSGKLPKYLQQNTWAQSAVVAESRCVTSLVASPLPGASHDCIALACHSDGELWRFYCSSSGIDREKLCEICNSRLDMNRNSDFTGMNKNYTRSLIWDPNQLVSPESCVRRFLLLTDHEIQCWETQMAPKAKLSRLWSHEIVGTDSDSCIKRDLAGQKQIWLLDMHFGERGKELTLLVATFCKDRVSSSSYMQYSLLTMRYKPESSTERLLEKKAPIQVIIPKARVENEDFLFTMKLRVGGKPSGSAVVLSRDGTATITNYWRGTTRLYQFDLPWDAGKVLDASILPSAEDSEEGAWIVLTEKAGLWTIPEKAILLCGVEPPERSLSRKGSSKEGASEEEKRSMQFGVSIPPRRASSEAWDAGNRQRVTFAGGSHRNTHDEEAEALLGQLFSDYLSNGQVDESFEKLKTCGIFEKDGETNVFCRASRSIVDTLAKHWTTTRGAEIVSLAVVSSQLLDKQQKHQKFLQFLALSKCHEELSDRQRNCLQIIMEHGEKLAAMIQLRDFQNNQLNNLSDGGESPSSRTAGALWDLIQTVGEKIRRNYVLLMDRDNAEVFYSKVSDLEGVFDCLCNNLQDIIGDRSLLDQILRVCELASMCITLIRSVINYRDGHHIWYPPPEGLTPWYCQLVVRSGLWAVASYILQLLKGANGLDLSLRSDLSSHLEGITDVVLETYSGAITAKIERGEEHNGLREEFWKRRDELLGSLYEQIKGLLEAKLLDSGEGTDVRDLELKEASFRELCLPLLSIARRHEGYQTLWHICLDLNDTRLLLSLMQESMGPRGGFTAFVFKQLYEKQQYAKLLRLGEEFQEELAYFLKQNKELLWLHEIFLNQFSSASETLHALALSQEKKLSLAFDEESEDDDTLRKPPSVTDRKRLLYLSKISCEAGNVADVEMKRRRIEADLHILKVQEDAINLFPGNEALQATKLLTPTELIELCLRSNNRELSLRAFDVFAWTSSSLRRSNKFLLEDCWRNAANQDDWARLYEASIAQGWSDEERLAFLRQTLLFQASNRCYGQDAQVYEGAFEEVLPLQKDGEYSGPSIEEIVMQHPDFTDAGQLMLTAIMMGKFGTDPVADNESFMVS